MEGGYQRCELLDNRFRRNSSTFGDGYPAIVLPPMLEDSCARSNSIEFPRRVTLYKTFLFAAKDWVRCRNKMTFYAHSAKGAEGRLDPDQARCRNLPTICRPWLLWPGRACARNNRTAEHALYEALLNSTTNLGPDRHVDAAGHRFIAGVLRRTHVQC